MKAKADIRFRRGVEIPLVKLSRKAARDGDIRYRRAVPLFGSESGTTYVQDAGIQFRMAKVPLVYYVEKQPQADDYHKVHAEGCQHMPPKEECRALEGKDDISVLCTVQALYYPKAEACTHCMYTIEEVFHIAETENDRNVRIGWKGVFSNYTVFLILQDCMWPVVCAAMVIIILCISPDVNNRLVFEKVISSSITVLPCILSLLIASYSIFLSTFQSRLGKNTIKHEAGKKIYKSLNASFAGTIFFIIVTLFINLILNAVKDAFKIDVLFTVLVFILLVMLFYSIWILKAITINIYNLGHISLVLTDQEGEEKSLSDGCASKGV
jgi:hypothetical protein